jgi:hypothetical protein
MRKSTVTISLVVVGVVGAMIWLRSPGQEKAGDAMAQQTANESAQMSGSIEQSAGQVGATESSEGQKVASPSESESQLAPKDSAQAQRVSSVSESSKVVSPDVEEEFSRESTQVLQALPKQEEMKNLKEHEMHDTPKAITQAGARIGDLEESLEKNPALKPKAIEFYEKCLIGSDYVSSIRAVCYSNLKKHDPANKTLTDERVPRFVRTIGEEI